MTHEEAIDSLVYWAETKGYVVDFSYNGDDSVDRESKIISINSTRSTETQLYVLLHECGHILVSKSDKVVNEYFNIFTIVSELRSGLFVDHWCLIHRTAFLSSRPSPKFILNSEAMDFADRRLFGTIRGDVQNYKY